MNAFLRFILESAICLTAFFAVYWLLLRKETYFRLNRAFLVSSLLLAFLIPALKIPSPLLTTTPARDIIFLTRGEAVRTSPIGLSDILLAVYAAGVLFFLVRFVIHLMKLRTVIRRCGVRNYGDLRIVSVDKDFSPFSFLNVVFLNEERSTEGSLQRILAHEQVHIRQFHTLDVLLMELVIIFQWFNPFVWPYKKSLKETHEYLADDGVIAQGFSAALYQLLVFEQHVGAQLFEFANNFKQSQIKRRITMMSKIKSRNAAKLKLLLVVPLASLLVLAFADPRPVSTAGHESMSAPQENAGHGREEFSRQKEETDQARQELQKLKEMEMKIQKKLETAGTPEQKKELEAKLSDVQTKRLQIEVTLKGEQSAAEPGVDVLKAAFKGLHEEEMKLREVIEKTDDPSKKAELKGVLKQILEKQAQLKAMSEASGKDKQLAIEDLKKASMMLKAKEEDVRAMLEKTTDPQKKAELEDILKKIALKQAALKEKAKALQAAEEAKK